MKYSNNNREIEVFFRDNYNFKHIIQLNGACQGLFFLLKFLNLNSKIAVPNIVCPELIKTIIDAGYIPFFLNPNPVNGNPDINEWKKSRDNGCKVALVTHLYGGVDNVSKIKEIYADSGMFVIDDAAQALGGKFNEGMCGSLGDFGLISFNATKHIEHGGGLLLTNSSDLVDFVFMNKKNSLVWKSNSYIKKYKEEFYTKQKFFFESQNLDIFKGLIEKIPPIEFGDWDHTKNELIINDLHNLFEEKKRRQDRFFKWKRFFEKKGYSNISISEDSNPWRFTARIDVGWYEMDQIAKKIRMNNIRVSHWYLPAGAFINGDVDEYYHAKEFSRGIFQFWLDEEAEVSELPRLNDII